MRVSRVAIADALLGQAPPEVRARFAVALLADVLDAPSMIAVRWALSGACDAKGAPILPDLSPTNPERT
jgi:hypothetical protein